MPTTDEQPAKASPKCITCDLPVTSPAYDVTHYGRAGVTYEHQACWQSRTFGGTDGRRHD